MQAPHAGRTRGVGGGGGEAAEVMGRARNWLCCVAGIRYRLALPHWMQQTAQMSGCGGKAANCFRQRHLRRMCGIGAAEKCAGSIGVRAGAVVKSSAGGEVRERGEWARCGCVCAVVRA